MRIIESYETSIFPIMSKILIVTLICFFLSARAYSQEIKRTVEVDTNEILIGDHINLSIFVNSPAENSIFWPQFNDTITRDIEIIEKSLLDTAQDINGNSYSQRLVLTIFDSGFYYIPPIRFYYKRTGDTSLYYFDSDPIPITVNTIAVDTSQVIRDIKAPLRVPYTFRELLPWILGSIALVLIVFFILYYLRRRKQSKPLFQIKPKPKIPPHRQALEALDKLKDEKLWQSGKVKAYHTELTDIIRVYLEGRYKIVAIEMTTAEILDALKVVSLEKQSIEKLDQILVLADFVKFAKLEPLPLEHDLSFNNSVSFVKETMERPNLEMKNDHNENSGVATAENEKL